MRTERRTDDASRKTRPATSGRAGLKEAFIMAKYTAKLHADHMNGIKFTRLFAEVNGVTLGELNAKISRLKECGYTLDRVSKQDENGAMRCIY